ncbi:MAG: NGG1p interacting factor NIF3 [Candidatus Diapherotrites archaeon]|nr:NGG1p interacting factor NIF3 [Candidatus Diapherotrites archaeon]
MASMKELFEYAVEQGIQEDPRPAKDIKKKLEKLKEDFQALKGNDKEFFDQERLENPYDDTRILYGEDTKKVQTVMIGIDIEVPELLLADRLREKGQKIDAVIAHHPEGKALAALHGVMDMQIHTLNEDGVPISQAEAVVRPRLDDVRKGLHAFNHSRVPTACKLLNVPFMNFHTIADNHVHQFLKKLMQEKKPETLQDILNILNEMPEYRWAQEHKMGPTLFNGIPINKVGKITYDMTGGTELDKSRVKKLAQAGISTIIAMHLSKDQVEECKTENINVVVAGHMSSDSLGMNLLLDKVEKKFGKLNIIEFAGFKRVNRKGK